MEKLNGGEGAMRANPESSTHDALCTKHDVAHYSGCMVGTGVGDAFGASVEFMTSVWQIKDDGSTVCK